LTFEYEYAIANHDGTYEHDTTERASTLICRHCKQGVAVVEERYTGDEPSRLKRFGGVISFRGFH
jgi:hypothetical protein